MSVRTSKKNQNKFQAKTMVETVGLAEWIIDDTCLVLTYFWDNQGITIWYNAYTCLDYLCHNFINLMYIVRVDLTKISSNSKAVIRNMNDLITVLFLTCNNSLQLTLPTLDSLHQLTTLLQSADYANSTAFYTSMVSGPSFAEIASFMPALKVLIQLCHQHQVTYY